MNIIVRFKLVGMALLIALSLTTGHAAGTITFGGGRFKWYQGTPQPTVFGVFWGTNQYELTLVEPLGTGAAVSSGIISAPSVYSIPGTEAGQVVYLRIRGWPASFGINWMQARQQFAGYGETTVLQVTLGNEAGPGTVIWQSAAGTDTDRFYPIELGRPLTPYNIVGFGNSSGYSYTLTVDEGNQGSVEAIIPVVRYGNTIPGFPQFGIGESVTVRLYTSNTTATAGQDYVPTNVIVRFDPGVTQQLVRIKLIADPLSEEDEQFSVHLSPTGSFVAINPTPFIVTIREARILSVRRSGGPAVITLRTAQGQLYSLQVSSDLLSWSTLAGFGRITGDGNAMEMTDPYSPCCEQRFYRVELLPF